MRLATPTLILILLPRINFPITAECPIALWGFLHPGTPFVHPTCSWYTGGAECLQGRLPCYILYVL